MVLVFDLDDTLYDETTYVKSGFRAVAKFLAEKFNLNEEEVFSDFLNEWQLNGRGRIFDNVLKKHHVYSAKLTKTCITVYRFHKPEIELSSEGKACLERFKNYPIYIVTDGNKVAQHNKIKALGLEDKVKRYFITHRFGIKNAKPSPYCFQKIAEAEKVNPQEIVYIADNITKDFVGIKPLGFKTIQVRTGQYFHLERPAEFHPDMKIDSLDELTEEKLHQLFQN